MTNQGSFEEAYPYWAAAQEAAKKVMPGNELQEAAASAIKGLAFEMEVRRAFPRGSAPTEVRDDHQGSNDINAVREGLPLRVSLDPDELASE